MIRNSTEVILEHLQLVFCIPSPTLVLRSEGISNLQSFYPHPSHKEIMQLFYTNNVDFLNVIFIFGVGLVLFSAIFKQLRNRNLNHPSAVHQISKSFTHLYQSSYLE